MDRYQAGMVLLEVGSRVGHLSTRQGRRRRSLAQPEEVWEALERAERRRVPLDILMAIATAQALLAGMKSQHAFYKEAARQYLIVIEKYQSCNEDKWHATRAQTDPEVSAAVRGLCIGMRFPRPEHVTDLVHASVECGRMTHTYPTGFLGCLCVALFASYAVQGKPVSQWGRCMLGTLPQAEEYCRGKSASFTDYSENWFYFETKWLFYLQQRKIDREGCEDPFFPENYTSSERKKLYRHWSTALSGKQKGMELPLMVYDAMLVAGGDWTKLCQWALCHGGGREGTGCMLGCLYGLLYGSFGVPSTFLLNLGMKDLMETLGEALYTAANGERPKLVDDATNSVDDAISSGRFSAGLWQAVQRLSCKRANEEINTLLNYTALLEQGAAGWQDSGQPRREGVRGKGRGRSKGAERPSQSHPSRFQLLRSRFTKHGLRDNLHRLRPPCLERPITIRSQKEKESEAKDGIHSTKFTSSHPAPVEEQHPKTSDISRPTIIRFRTGSKSPPERTGWKSPSERTGPESPSQRTRPESPSKRTGLESPCKRTGPETPSESTGSESPPKRSGPELPPEMSGPASSPETKAQHRPAVPQTPLYADSPHSPKPLPWKYRTHYYAEDFCTPPTPKIILSMGMRGGRLVKRS